MHIIALKAFFSVCCLLLFSSCVHPNVSFRTAMKSRMHTTPHIQSTTPRSCLSVADWPSELYTLLRQIRLSRMYRTTGAKRREFLHLPRFVLLTRRARFYSRCSASSIWMSSIHPISQRFWWLFRYVRRCFLAALVSGPICTVERNKSWCQWRW